MPKGSNAEYIATLEAKLAAAREREENKAITQSQSLLGQIKAIDARVIRAGETKDKAIAKAEETYKATVEKAEEKRLHLEQQLNDLAVTDAKALTFSSAQVEQV
jgi:hypothetical protein